MSKVVQYMFLLIALLIIVAYWTGSTNVAGTLFSGVNNLVNTLQGKNKNGEFSNYPS